MVLDEPAYSLQGTLLLPEGTVLTERSIRVLKTWGVRRLHVQEEESEGVQPEDAENRRACEIRERLAARFSDVLDDDIMAAIMRAAEKVLSGKRRRPADDERP